MRKTFSSKRTREPKDKSEGEGESESEEGSYHDIDDARRKKRLKVTTKFLDNLESQSNELQSIGTEFDCADQRKLIKLEGIETVKELQN